MKEFTCSFTAFEDVFRKGCITEKKGKEKENVG